MSRERPTWQEVIAIGLWLMAGACLTSVGRFLPLLEWIILWVILVVGLLILLRRFWSWLLGPLFLHDLD